VFGGQAVPGVQCRSRVKCKKNRLLEGGNRIYSRYLSLKGRKLWGATEGGRLLSGGALEGLSLDSIGLEQIDPREIGQRKGGVTIWELEKRSADIQLIGGF